MTRKTVKAPTQRARLTVLATEARKAPITTKHVPTRIDYKAMKDAELRVWLGERPTYWRTRARQIERQGVRGFVKRCEALIAKARVA